jgi:pyruvate dehydrogenase E2 component (dihydrolipoamide acetyltransferase)
MFEFKLPDLGEGVHEGEILAWHVELGAAIQEDQPLVDVETDKAAITIPSPRSGTIVSRKGEIGDTVFVGDVVVVIDDGAESGAADEGEEVARVSSAVGETASAQASSAAATASRANNRTSSTAAVAAAPAPAWGRVVAAPATRRLARELQVDIAQVPPTGPGGRVTAEDVGRFAGRAGDETLAAPDEEPQRLEERTDEAPEVTGRAGKPGASTIPLLDLEPLPDFAEWGPVEIEPFRSIRRKVARKMVTSMILAPHVAHMDEADVTRLEELRRREKERRSEQPGGRLTMLAFVIKAVTAGLKASPSFNASLDPFNERIIYKKYYHVGVAVDTEHGLIVPVIRDADRKSVLEISAEIEEVAARARKGELSVGDLRGGTFTITNIGALGGTGMIPTINYPEVAILGMARVQEKPVVVDGQVVVRKMLPLTLAFDHRVADGAEAARFANGIVRRLSDPDTLLVEG